MNLTHRRLPGCEHFDTAPFDQAAMHLGHAITGIGAQVFWAKEWSKSLADDILSQLTGAPWFVVTDEPEGWLLVSIPGMKEDPCPHCVSWALHNGPLRRLSREGHHLNPLRQLMRSPMEFMHIAHALHESISLPGASLVHWPQMSHWPRQVGHRHRLPQREYLWREPWCPSCGEKHGTPEPVDGNAIIQHHFDHAGPWVGRFSEWGTYGLPPWGCNVTLNVTARGDGRALPGARDRASGKGRNELESARSAVGECIERRAVTAPPPWMYVADDISTNDLLRRGGLVMTPAECNPFGEKQWAERRAINARGHAHYKVPAHRADNDTSLDWVKAWDYVEKAYRRIPLDHVFYRPGIPRKYFVPDTNGAAASPDSFEEAACRGFRELVERDAYAPWWFFMQEGKPEIPLEIDPWTAQAKKVFWEQHRRHVHLLDLTVIPSMPVVQCVTYLDTPLQTGPAKGGLDIITGAGCGVDTAEAARRAVGEAVQCMGSNLTFEQRQAIHNNDPDALIGAGWNRDTAPWHWPGVDAPSIVLPRKYDAREELQRYAQIMKDMGSWLAVVDISPGARDLRVAKVFTPTLVHFWLRAGQPRLYELSGVEGVTEDDIPQRVQQWL